jgi:two-component system CheB/CheR fusion protein
VIVPEDKELAFQKIEESRLNHNVYEVDYRIARANDGEIVWIKSTGHYHYDEFGIAHTLTGVSIDISKQRRSKNYLKQ